jgi:two-component system, sensor histidine kinase YesM
MRQRLKNSLEETVISRSHEVHSLMLSLQSQMNPHFLYNTISVISVMAEEDGKVNIVKACEDLSNMLRYISSESSEPVLLSLELEHTLSFMNLMKLRYADDLSFSLNIPENMHTIKIPKLVIQPLVENCTKYAINVDPPWKTEITGIVSSNQWEIIVQDNGTGFNEAWLDSVKKRFELINIYNMPELKLNGMGLANIFIRLKLLYGKDAIFELYNHPDGGAIVKIGGTIL